MKKFFEPWLNYSEKDKIQTIGGGFISYVRSNTYRFYLA